MPSEWQKIAASVEAEAASFPMVYRNTHPTAMHGRMCRIIQQAPARYLREGGRVIDSGEQFVAVEFSDGEKASVRRCAITPVDGRLGRQTLIKIARGGLRPIDIRTRAEREARAR